jgi:hypothetical protein
VHLNGTYDIAYDDGEREQGLESRDVRAMDGRGGSGGGGSASGGKLYEGDKVEANYRGKGKWYPGKVSRVRLNGTYDIAYDDGEREPGLAPSLVRLL